MAALRGQLDRVREHRMALLGAGAGLALLAVLGLGDFAFNDYDTEASASVSALVAGHVGRFLELAPAYGGSLALRAPFALIPKLWNGGELAVYRLLALPCLLAAGALAVWLAARMRAAGKSPLARGAAVALVVANPVSLYALQIGHPEELLAGTLCLAAVLAATRSRWVAAALLLGLAVGCKSWALVGAAPVIALLPGRRAAASALGAAVAAALIAPFAIAQHLHAAGGTGALASGPIFEPGQWWWWLGSHGVVRGTNGLVKPGFRLEPGWLSPVAHPLVVALSLPLTPLWLRRRRGRPAEPLALLALVLLARCALDPWDNLYYALPLLLALVAWESLGEAPAPVLALMGTVCVYATLHELPGRVGPDAVSFFYLMWSVPLAGALGLWLFAPDLLARIAGRRRALADVEQVLGKAA